MAGTNILVTESFLAANFSPKNGHTPGSDNSIHLDCDTIISRYYVTIQGVTSTGNRCPSQNELVSTPPFASNYLIYNYYTSVDSRNITSTGWSVPSKTTYENIISHLGGYSASLAKLKSTTSWRTPGNNSSGFNAKSNGGANYYPTQTYGSGVFMLNWTTTSYSSADAWHFGIQDDSVWLESYRIHKWIGGTLRAFRSTSNADGTYGVYYGNDGKAYQTVAIGGIEITTQDLEETKFRNGDSVPYINNGYTWYDDGNLSLPCSTYYGDLSITTTTTTTAEPVIWYILWYNCQTSSNDRQSGPYTQSYVNSIFVYNRRYYDAGGNSYWMANAANSSWGQSSITPSYTYNETGCPVATTTTTAAPICYNLTGEEAYITIAATSTEWCSNMTKVAHIMSADTPSITTATKIYSGSDCVTYAAAGYYGIALSGNWRYWNGTAFTSSGTCPVTTTTTTEPVTWYILWYNCQTSSNDRQSGPYTQSYVNSIFVYNRRYYDSGGNSYWMSNAANASWGQASVTVSYTNNETGCPVATTTTTAAAGYYDCGYGCQYYAYNPGCPSCNPASTTTTTTSGFYGYLVNAYTCPGCSLVELGILVQDTRSDLLLNKYYADGNSGYAYKIVDNNQSLGGLPSLCVGSGATSCAGVACV
jgi:uncharacterized protein (TIGR02145 family)